MKYSILFFSIVATFFSLVSTSSYASSSGTAFNCSWQNISRERLNIGPPNIISERIVQRCVKGGVSAASRTVVVGVYQSCHIYLASDEFFYTGSCLNPSIRRHELCPITVPGYPRYEGYASCGSVDQNGRQHNHSRLFSNHPNPRVWLGDSFTGTCSALLSLMPNWQDPIVVDYEPCP